MIVPVGSGHKRSIEPFADRRDCERKRSLQSFSDAFDSLNRETLRSDLELIDGKAEGLIACSRLSLPVCREVLGMGAILMSDLTEREDEKGEERFEEHFL